MAKRVDIPLTDTTIAALPCIEKHLDVLEQLAALHPTLLKELSAAARGSGITAARAYLSLYLLMTRMEAVFRQFDAAAKQYKEDRLPQVFELEGITHVPLEEGYRVQTSETMYVSVKDGMRAQAMEWLRKTATKSKDGGALADLIIETINSSTLSAAGRYMLSEEGLDLPGDLFESYFQPTTSVVRIRK